MTWLASFALVWAALVATAIGANIEGTISFPAGVAAPESTDGAIPSFQVVLDGGARSTLSKQDGHFIFHDVPAGRYTVDIHSPVYMFSQFKVDISASGDVRALEFKYPGTPKIAVTHPLAAEALVKVQYFQPREKFSAMDLVRNPSFLGLIVPIVLVWLLPKLTESMLDPEEFKQAQEEMGAVGDPQAMLKGLFGGGSGDAKDEEDSD
ncbi:Aste57867_10142 [Aphanomyces stellatus]|uniref:Aste57867_10142 protein n=1 Tax=Aphanomyces stellatus TaxID=120398 RepID=A0A485KQC6_9STRA|nr:hypothetical protein As57867_010103 [Aphanomyces stellatus]VFT87018.1 Aste57867_10142 [Aphanomyces stellatus]